MGSEEDVARMTAAAVREAAEHGARRVNGVLLAAGVWGVLYPDDDSTDEARSRPTAEEEMAMLWWPGGPGGRSLWLGTTRRLWWLHDPMPRDGVR